MEWTAGINRIVEQYVPDRVETPYDPDDPPVMRKDAVFGLLKNPRRRATLRYMLDKDRELYDKSEVTDAVAAWETGSDFAVAPDTAVVDPNHRKRVYISLHQNHFPRLDEEDVIDYDQEANKIAPEPGIHVLEPHIDERVAAREDYLRPTRRNRPAILKDDAFDLLKNARRRAVLRYMLGQPEQEAFDLRDIADEIVNLETGPDELGDSQYRKGVYAVLYQTHVPRLVEHDIVAYDRGTVRPRPAIHVLEPYLADGFDPDTAVLDPSFEAVDSADRRIITAPEWFSPPWSF